MYSLEENVQTSRMPVDRLQYPIRCVMLLLLINVFNVHSMTNRYVRMLWQWYDNCTIISAAFVS